MTGLATNRPLPGRAPEAGAKEVELLTTAPDADDERGEWTPEELEAEEMAQIAAVTASAEADAPRDAVRCGARRLPRSSSRPAEITL